MKKIGIILAALVITMFFVGAVAAMPANNPPDQREKFREDCCVQGEGYILYEKSILDKEIAVDVYEYMSGYTGKYGNGSFAMTIHEVLNEGIRLNCTANCSAQGLITDPIYGDAHSPVMINFECKKMIQFETTDDDAGLAGVATYSSPGFHGGLNAQVTETYSVWKLQKDETVKMTTTATFDKDTKRIWDGCGKVAKPYTANELSYDSKNDFGGTWGTHSTWKKVCSKDIEHRQEFIGDFQVDKYLMFKEEVTEPCPEKEPKGDC